MEPWPTAILPIASRQNYGNEPQSGVTRTEFDTGAVLQRSRFTAEQMGIPVRWFFTDFQFAMFKSWFRHKITRGADWFTAEMPMGDGLNNVVNCRFINGVYKARWAEGPRKADGTASFAWEVTASLETNNPPALTEDAFDFFNDAGIDIDMLESVVGHSYTFWNVTLPANPAYAA